MIGLGSDNKLLLLHQVKASQLSWTTARGWFLVVRSRTVTTSSKVVGQQRISECLALWTKRAPGRSWSRIGWFSRGVKLFNSSTSHLSNRWRSSSSGLSWWATGDHMGVVFSTWPPFLHQVRKKYWSIIQQSHSRLWRSTEIRSGL